MKRNHASDAMKRALEKDSGNKVAALHYFQPPQKMSRKKKSPRAIPPEQPRNELLLDRTPANFDLALLKEQMDLLQEGILSIHKKLSDLETANLAFQEENKRLREDSLKLTPPLIQNHGTADERDPYEPHKLPTGVTLYRHTVTGACVCPKCFEHDRAAIKILPFRVRISTIGHCPRCHDKFHTEESERKPVNVLPPEDTESMEAERPKSAEKEDVE